MTVQQSPAQVVKAKGVSHGINLWYESGFYFYVALSGTL